MPSHIILGGGGFLGRHLALSLAQTGERVRAVDKIFPVEAQAEIEHVISDLHGLSAEDLADLITGWDVVHHLIWSTVPAIANAHPERDVRENLGFMIRLLEAVRHTQVRLIFASSGGTVYGTDTLHAFAEDHPIFPIGVYGVSKVSAELYANVYRANHGSDIRIARLSNPYGTGQLTSSLQGAVSRFVNLALARQPVEIWGTGEVVRDFIHVQDTVRGMVRLANADLAALGPFVFNIGSGRGTSLNEIVQLLADILKRPIKTVYRESRSFDVPRNVLDVSRAGSLLGWHAEISLRQGIGRMIEEIERDPSSLLSKLDPV